MEKTNITWLNSTLSAIYHLGGEATLNDIYNRVAALRYEHNQSMPQSWRAIVRRTLENYSSDSESFLNKEDFFKSTYGLGEGTWSIR